MTSSASRYDVVVIGAGPSGENVADRVVRAGLSCLVIESELVGGECSYWACMPSKAMLRPVELLAAAGRVPGVPTGRLDPAAVFARRDEFTSHHDDTGQARWVTDLPADLIRGAGRLSGVREVPVTRAGDVPLVVTAALAVVVATGSDAAVPDIPGLAGAGAWTSREVTNASVVPARLAVLGGGVVACEMAQAYAALGSAVTLIERGSRLLSRLEPFAGELVADALTAAGVDLRTGRQVLEVRRPGGGGPVTLLLDGGTGATDTIEADELLVATGRRPRTQRLGLETVGLRPGDWIRVDDTLCAVDVAGDDGQWLYAVGDVNARNLLTHMGKYQARACGDIIAARAAGREIPGLLAVADGLGAPQVICTGTWPPPSNVLACCSTATTRRIRRVRRRSAPT